MAFTRSFSRLDRALIEIERALGTSLNARPAAQRNSPAAGIVDAELDETQRRHAAGLMRVNHTGEVCAQALYSGQAAVARNAATRDRLLQAAAEETDHLAWCNERLEELSSRPSLLNPLWYGGAFVLGAAAGALGDRWNLAFLAETERQVEEHLTGHLDRLSAEDARTRAVIEAMRSDEARHRQSALALGAAQMPEPLKLAMRAMAKVMTTVAYRV